MRLGNREEIRRNTLSKTPSKNPTGPGEDMELPIYFLKLHETTPTGPGENIELPIYFLKLHETTPTGPGCPKLGEKTEN